MCVYTGLLATEMGRKAINSVSMLPSAAVSKWEHALLNFSVILFYSDHVSALFITLGREVMLRVQNTLASCSNIIYLIYCIGKRVKL